jgi:hypothetical protein
MPGWLGSLVVHLRPQPTSPPTQRFYIIPSAPMASRYHCGRGRDNTNNRIVAQVEGIGLVLQILKILEGGHSACLFVFRLHKFLWQHQILVLGLAGRLLQLTFLPTRPPQLSNVLIVLTLLISQSTTRCGRSAWRMPSLSWNATCFAQGVTYATMTTLFFRSLASFGLSFGRVIWTMGSTLDARVDLFLGEVFFFGSSFLSTIFLVELGPCSFLCLAFLSGLFVHPLCLYTSILAFPYESVGGCYRIAVDTLST